MAALLVASTLSCDFFTDLVTPQELSTAEVAVVLIDTNGLDTRGIAGAQVSVGGGTAASDSTGLALIADARTGMRAVTVIHPHYLPASDTIDVPLDGMRDTLHLRRRPIPPIIRSITASPSKTAAIDDVIEITLALSDTAWPIHIVKFDFGDNQPRSLTYPAPWLVPSELTVSHTYDSAASFWITALVLNDNSDAARDSVQVIVSPNRRPDISVILPRGGQGFYSGDAEGSHITVGVQDPDNNLVRVAIDWGDNRGDSRWSDFVPDTGYQDVRTHVYILPDSVSSAEYTLTVEAFDDSGAVGRYVSSVPVIRMPPLVVQSTLEFIPSENVPRSDSVLRVGARVLDTPGYITQVLWLLHPSETRQVIGKWPPPDTMADSITGAVGGSGRLFECPIDIRGFGDTNVVEVLISDSRQQNKSVRDTFYVIGN